jgi:hypothetical protein
VPFRPVNDAWQGGGAFDDSGWTLVAGGSGMIGYDLSLRAGSRFSLDVGAMMYGLRTSCCIRVPFAFTGNLQNVAGLTLKIHYNDGFVAYLNGVEIARRNFTGIAAWNSAADRQLDGDNFESIPIVSSANALRSGSNVLAIQGLNVSALSPDFLMSVELAADESGGLETPTRVNSYTAPIRLGESSHIKARALVGGRWSALNEAVFGIE